MSSDQVMADINLDDRLKHIKDHVFREGANGILIYPKVTDDAHNTKKLFTERLQEYSQQGLAFVSDSLAVITNVNVGPKPCDVLFDACLVLPEDVTIVLTVVSATQNLTNDVRKYNVTLTREIIQSFRRFTDEPFSASHGVLTGSDLQTKESFCQGLQLLVEDSTTFCISDSLYIDEDKYQKIVLALLATVTLTASVQEHNDPDTIGFLTLDQFNILTENLDLREVTVKIAPSRESKLLMMETACRLEKSGPTMLLLDSREDVEQARRHKVCTFCCTQHDLRRKIQEEELSGLHNLVTNCGIFPFKSRLIGCIWMFVYSQDDIQIWTPKVICDSDVVLDTQKDEVTSFIDTSAYYSAKTILCTHGHVTLIGEAGSGKTSIALQLMRENRHQCKPVVIQQLKDLKALKYVKVPTLVLVDDIFGNGVFLQEYFTDMIDALELLEMRMKSKNFKLILTSRKYIFREALDKLKMKMDFVFSHSTIFDLSSDDTTTAYDKSKLLDTYVLSSGISVAPLTRAAIVNMKTSYSFPLVCAMIAEMPFWHDKLLQFFSEPIAVYEESLQQLYHFDPEKFSLLLLVLLKRALDIKNIQVDEDVGKVLKFSKVENSKAFSADIHKLLIPLCGTFLKRNMDEVSFRTETVEGAVALTAGRIDSVFFISNCTLETVYDRISIGVNNEDSDTHHIVLSDNKIPYLVERFAAEVKKRSFALVCTHQACFNQMFVDNLLQSVTEECAAFHVSDILYTGSFLHWAVAGGSEILLKRLLARVDFDETEIRDAILISCIAGQVQQLETLLDLHNKIGHDLSKKFNSTVPVMKTDSFHFRVKIDKVEDETLLQVARRHGHKNIENVLQKYGIVTGSSVTFTTGSISDIYNNDHDNQSADEFIHPSYVDGAHLHLQLESEASTEVRDENGETLLHKVVAGGYNEMVEVLLAICLMYGNNIVHKTNNRAETALHLAALAGYVEIAQKLIDHGSVVNSKTTEDQTPLHYASGKGRHETVQLLLQHSASVNAEDIKGQTPLHLAAGWGDPVVIKELIEHGADVLCDDKDKQIPLHLATCTGQTEVLELLLTHNGGVIRCDAKGYASLHIATRNVDYDAVKLLLTNGSDINIQDILLQTPLHAAVAGCNSEMVELLLDSNADVHAKDVNGKTALHMTACHRHIQIAQILLKRGAKIDTQTENGQTPLHIASKTGNLDIVIEFLAHGADVNSLDVNSHSPLYFAVRAGHSIITDMLLSHKADIIIKDRNAESVLHLAVRYGFTSILKVLFSKETRVTILDGEEFILEQVMKYDIDVDSKSGTGQTCLHIAVEEGNIHVSELLISNMADIGIRDVNGQTVLHVAIRKGNINLLKFLLTKGADVNAQDCKEQTPVHLASRLGDHDSLQILLQEDVDLTSKDETGMTSLHVAAWCGTVETVRVLLQKKLTIHDRDKKNRFPLHLAAEKGQTAISQLLLEEGSNINAVDENQRTALHLAAVSGEEDTVELLVANNADINAADSANETPLHLAARHERDDNMKKLLLHSADVDPKNKTGMTPLHIAVMKNYQKCVELLLEYQADVNALSDEGQTPMHVAAREGCSTVVQMLIDHQAQTDVIDMEGKIPLELTYRNRTAQILLRNERSLDVQTAGVFLRTMKTREERLSSSSSERG